MRTLLIISICLLAHAVIARASAEVPDDIRARLTGRGHALLIGVSKYDDNAWPSLPSVTADIASLAKGVAPHFATVEVLIDPTTETIRDRLREFMTGRWNLPDERLLIYYAGHGFTDFNPNSRTYTGYVTGKNTSACIGTNCDKAIGTAIPFNYIDGLNRESRVQQVITLFDSCFSGLAVVKGPDTEATHYAIAQAREEMGKPVRYYITAGGANETVPADSPFATLILNGLNGAADFWKDGFLTAEELGIYLERNVPVHASRPLTPVKSFIADQTGRLSSGQFIFLTGLTATVAPDKLNSALSKVLEQAFAASARKDDREAARLFRIAADQGSAEGQINLGYLLLEWPGWTT